MSSTHEPVLQPTPILSLRPTQMTLGLIEVNEKREAWKAKVSEKLAEFLAAHMVPVIKGLKGEPYLTDHHHLARALYEEGVKSVYITVIADLSRLPEDHFWNMMDFHGWTHPYDAKGRRRDYSELPRTIKTMEDDPYRSLAGLLRTQGGFAKDSTPFSEFLWADFLRPRIKAKSDQSRLQGCIDEGADLGEERRRRLFARLERTARLRAARGRKGEGPKRQEEKRRRCPVPSSGGLIGSTRRRSSLFSGGSQPTPQATGGAPCHRRPDRRRR